MAKQTLDTTGNDDLGKLIGRVNDMFTELYDADNSNTVWSGVSVTASDLVTAESLKLDTGTKTATATTGAATLSKTAGAVTSEALTTAAGATYTLTLTNTKIAAASQVFASVKYGTATAGMPAVTMVTPAAGSVDIIVQNVHASAALDGTIVISFMVLDN